VSTFLSGLWVFESTSTTLSPLLLIRNSVWAAAAAVTLTAARFALIAIVARRLSQAGFGQFAYAQWLIDLAFLICSLGAPGVASRYVAEYSTRPEKLAALILRWRPFAFGLPAVTSGGVLLGALVSGLHLSEATTAMLALWAAASGLWSMQTATLTGLQRFDLIFRANMLAGAIMLTGALALPLHGDDLALPCGLMAIACGAAAMVGITATRHLVGGVVGSIEPDGWRSIRGYAFNIWITALLWSLVWSRGEMPIVRIYLGDAGVAQYAAAMTLFGGAIQGVMLAVSGIASQLTMLWGSGRRDDAIATARSVMDVQLIFCGAGALLLICLGPELISLAFGNAYRQASMPLAVFAVGLLAIAVSSQSHLLQIATDARFSRDTMLLGLLLLFGTTIVLTPLLGLSGAAVARSGTMLLLALISLVEVTRRWGKVAVSGRNVLVVAAVVGVTVLAATWKDGSRLLLRAALLSAALVVLAVAMRDRHGRILGLALPRSIWASTGGSEAGTRNGSETDKAKAA
jgi:O-antigen/teichoic acid export membrane protein